MYHSLKPWLFRSDPEQAHDVTMRLLALTSDHPGALRLASWFFEKRDPRLDIHRFGLHCLSPIGLAAGFDKNALATPAWAALGFGFVEVGSVTALAQVGNPKPRLFRLPEDEALINRFGFNNDGAEAVAKRLEQQRPHLHVPVGVNIGKSKVVRLENAVDDYLASFRTLWEVGDYFVVNVSSPNTVGLRDLQQAGMIDDLLEPIAQFASGRKPLFVKVTVDAPDTHLEAVTNAAQRLGLTGIVVSNTTVTRDNLHNPQQHETGGLSGKPLADSALAQLRAIKQHAPELGLIAVGGIANAEDVVIRMRAGASLVQLYTGLVYQGPWLLRRIHRDLLEYVTSEKLLSLSEIIGLDA
jgi:dihydroorotate dehydrogenase